jgi:hypothetical protein
METLIIAGVAAAFVAFFALALRLAPDTRDGLRGKEEELASYLVNWASDPAYDRALAAELRVARRRHAGQPADAGAIGPAVRWGAAGAPLRAGAAGAIR